MDACGMRVAGGRRSEGETTRRKKGETREGGGVLHTACRGDDGRSDVTLSLMFGGSACELCGLFSFLGSLSPSVAISLLSVLGGGPAAARARDIPIPWYRGAWTGADSAQWFSDELC